MLLPLRKWSPFSAPGPETQLVHRSKMMSYDQPLIWVTMILMLMGVVMVYSASISLPDSPKYANYKNTHFLTRQALFVLVSVITAALVFRVPVATWQKAAPYLFVFVLLLLVAVLIPGLGKGVNGAKRWLSFKVFNLQPSEFMKLFMVLYAADYTVRKQEYMHKLTKGFFPMMAAVAVVGLLLLLEPDLGAFGVIVCIAMGILFLGGINGVWFGGIAATLVGIFTMVIVLSPWRRERIFAYLNPWQEDNALGKAYQLSHSLIAFGRGELFGVGLGASVEKLHYLPEAHTDFLLAVIGEELGFVGVMVVILLFYWILKRAFEIGRQAIALDQTFAGLTAKGIGIWIGVQAFINMGVNLGLLPTKGLTLPLMSYGGSGVMINCIGLAILLRVDYENRVLMRGGRA
ncbi:MULTISPECIES: putative lipid II flippase FtsW [unclassified Undibacterium]|uniref:putative lipid II flippase FtsW n=1 Tax=unclassified Undibacterium TaxID=2630295 RepID=UPI002AC9D357|nr:MULTISPECIES: putative lipid II flippase FtsW [unclassified Undibacterium]MEB0138656.1 putative lipid II flippase FtsW [Undibacterium sp. CCC2.1]MEB0171457.1 putative lipid II flippase FtsW [Undibacterium sp. CCC1.1]MEB0175787.1 putative lipid II flippase FtsW [Undibacterium sp. CCC3.4]MEB0214384.1 putative lipid II flippase FtsW [Undibacterium sp. 5I2]WPX45583.1 putative lipid II flippase FtsW [Undibacterium sp. CCC3.4]